VLRLCDGRRRRVEEGIMRYNRWLRRAKHEKLDDLIARNILYVSGAWKPSSTDRARCRPPTAYLRGPLRGAAIAV